MKTIVFYWRVSLTSDEWKKLKTLDANRQSVLPAKGDYVIIKGSKYLVDKIEVDYDQEVIKVYLI